MSLMPCFVPRQSRLVTLSAMVIAALVGPSRADEVELKMPIISEQRHLYYVGLLEAEAEMGENGAGIVI